MDVTRCTDASKEQKKINEEERQREDYNHLREGENYVYIVQDERNTFSLHVLMLIDYAFFYSKYWNICKKNL